MFQVPVIPSVTSHCENISEPTNWKLVWASATQHSMKQYGELQRNNGSTLYHNIGINFMGDLCPGGAQYGCRQEE
jgi:hypothetical protein